MMAVLMGEVKVTGDTSQALKLSSLQPILNQARDRAAKAAGSDSSTRCTAAGPGAEDDQDGHEAPVKLLVGGGDESPLSLVGGDHHYHHRRDRLDSASNASDDGRSSDSDSDADDVLILQSEREHDDGRRAKAAGAVLPPELNLLDAGAMEAIGFDCGQCIPQAWIDDDDDDVAIG